MFLSFTSLTMCFSIDGEDDNDRDGGAGSSIYAGSHTLNNFNL